MNTGYGRLQTEQDIRPSRVFPETGPFEDAVGLQEMALGYVYRRPGTDHPAAISLLTLSKTVWEMSEINRATQ